MTRSNVVVFIQKIVIQLMVIAVLWGILFLFQHYHLADYLPRKWVVLVHVIGTVIFLGNIIVTAAWMFGAGRSEQPLVVNFAANRINRCDMYFIQPGVFVLLISGLILAVDLGSGFNAGWMIVGVALFSLSGVVWGLFLRKYQNRMVKITESCLESTDGAPVCDELPEEFYNVFLRWQIWGTVAIVLVVTSLGFMSLKPNLW